MLRTVALLLVTITPPVPTRTADVVETIHGVQVHDPYRWLEDADAPEVKAWTAAQNAHMRRVLDAVPGRADLEKRLWQLHEIGSLGVPVRRGSGKTLRYFYTRRDGKQNQPVLYVRDGKGERPLLDVNALAADGTRSLDWWTPSEDGRLVAYGVSANGDEESVLRVRDAATGRDLPDSIDRARAASIAWLPDGKGFYYTRYPAAGSVPAGEDKYHRTVFLHRLGADPARDVQVFPRAGQTRDMTDWPSVALSPHGRWLTIEVGQGWAKSELYLVDTHHPDAAPVALVTGRDALYTVSDVLDDRLYVLTNDGAPRYRLFAIDPAHPARDRWREVLPQGEETLEAAAVVGGKLATLSLKDASSRVRIYTTDGKLVRDVALPTLGTATTISGRPESDELFVGFTSFLVPTTVLRHEVRTGATSEWAKLPSPIDASAFEVSQERYQSKDGTSVPMFLVHRKGLVRDGTNPTVLYGYGGFNVSVTPAFAASMAPFIERGGVYAVANLRGGAEYGEDWHRAGMLAHKQNVFDDFAAAAEHLIRTKVTSPAHLAISGRSNGGLLVGAAITQHPELFRAAICGVPLLDMVRYHKFRIAKLWIPEYGDPDKPDELRWLYAYSPYHHVKDGVRYPAMLIFTAESDTRVDPMHARKMTARLQAASSSGRPILLRLETQAGHGAGKPIGKLVAQYTDELAFLFRELFPQKESSR